MKRDDINISLSLAALALALAVIVAYVMSSCSASRHAESNHAAAERISVDYGMGYDSLGTSVKWRSLEDAMSSIETYSIAIFDTSRKDTASNTYPIKAQINGTKQTDKTSISSQVSSDSSRVGEIENLAMQAAGKTESNSESGFKSKPDITARLAMFVLIIALLVAVPYIFKFIIKNILRPWQ